MPPSGFNQKAINGLLKFVNASYQVVLGEYKDSDLSESKFLEESAGRLEEIAKQAAQAILPKFSPEGVLGLATFVSENYRDLVREVRVGKKPEGYAVQTELEHIRLFLSKFEI